MIKKIDFKKELKHLYNPSKIEFSVVDVPVMKFLMIDGQGDPNTAPAYQQAVEALYGTAFPIKFAVKKQGYDYTVPPLEGLWWVDDMSEFSLEAKDQWKWTMMIMQPEQVTPELVEQIRGEVIKKKDLPSLSKLRFETYKESLCVQIMYTGPYKDEGPTIARMHAFIEAEGYVRKGKHHEIYLGDPRRTAPENLKTVIRQPVQKVDSSN